MEWEFSVQNNMTDPLRYMGASMGKLDEQLKNTTKEIETLERAGQLEKLKKASPVEQQIGYLKIYQADLKRAAEAQDHATEKGGFFKRLVGEEGFFATEQIKNIAEFTGKIYELGKSLVSAAVEASDFKGDTLAMLEVMTGSSEAANEEFETLGIIARNTSMTKKEVMGQYTELFSFTQKFGTKAAQDVIAAGSDIEKLLGKNAQSTFIGTMKNIEAMGGLNERMVKGLKEVGVATPEKLYAALASELKTTTEGAKALIKAGKVSQETTVNTLLGLVQTNIDKGGPLGLFGVEQAAKDVEDQLKNLKEGFFGIFEDVNTDALGDALSAIVDTMREGSPVGDHLRQVAGRAFDDLAKLAKYAAENMDNWATKADKVLKVIEKVGGFMTAHPDITKILMGAAAGGAVGGVWGAAIGAAGVAGGIGGYRAMEAISGPIPDENKSGEGLKTAQDQLAEMQLKLNEKLRSNEQLEFAAKEAGIQTANGFMEGLAERLAVEDAVNKQIINPLDKALKIHSPSDVMIGRGLLTAEGFNIGLGRGLAKSDVSASMGFGMGTGGGSMPAPDAFPAMPADASRGGSGAVVHIALTNNFEGGVPTDHNQVQQFNTQQQEAIETGVLMAMESWAHQN